MPVTQEPDEPLQPAESTRPEGAPSSARGRRAMPRSVLAAALIGAGLVAGLAIAAVGLPEPRHPSTPRAMRSSARRFRQRPWRPKRTRRIAGSTCWSRATSSAPDLDGAAHATRIARGEVVEFRITAPIEGAASVHGLSDLVADEGRGARNAAIQGDLQRAVPSALSRRRWFSHRGLGAERRADAVMTGA